MKSKIILVLLMMLMGTLFNSCGSGGGGQDETMSWPNEPIADISTQRPSNEALVAAKAVISGFENSSQQSLDNLNNAQD